ncbi:MAG TPA: sugar ABC transporter substrate-binding protein [Geminicoccus sp.]|uniref:sugar ABC transporter substrate-binding protein n=1 Tax=Geminicoccus sp. TaxID=2024832 RepID=UPI002B8B286A|nr:sugar ABC transporter substrate-binding protein [Geminicoccus sp.]HWL66875.1 sugar ABC transporter substrate-binding protein [Geminicoccus sp.]
MDRFKLLELGRRGLLGGGALAAAGLIGLSGGRGLVRPAAAAEGDDVPSLEGKTIAISIVGTDHHWDLEAYKAQIAEVERLGGTAVGLDAGRNDQKLVAQLQTVIGQKPDAVVQTLGTLSVIEPWLIRIKEAGIPLFTVDVPTPHSINNTTSDNFMIGSSLALQLVSDLGGKGNVVVFNGFYGVPVCAIRYDQLRAVLKYFPDVKILEPELRDVIPNTVQDAYTQITAVLNKYPEKGSVDAVWSAWDVPQLGATQAIAAAGRNEVRTYGVDGSPEVVELVKDPDSPAAAVAAQQPAAIGKTSIQNVARHLAGQPVPSFTFLPSILVTKANAAEAQKQLGQG